MANWTFLEEYGKQYPSLAESVLGMLVFSEHALDGDNFKGTLDVAASGVALGTLGPLVELNSFDVSGTVANTGKTLTVILETSPTVFVPGISKTLPLIGNQVTAAGLKIHEITDTTEGSGDEPTLDIVALTVTFMAGDKSLTIETQIPMNGGLFTIKGTFDNVGITLEDLGSLMGQNWFPANQLGPYNKSALSLLGLNLTLYVKLKPSFSITVVSVTAGIGLTGIELMSERLYMNPLGVWVTVAKSKPAFAIEGSIALCNYDRPGDYKDPDFVFDFSLGVPEFSFSGELDNPDPKLTINTMLKDLLGKDTAVGLPSNLTLRKFAFEGSADTTSGSLTDFSMEIAMSGGFGVFGPSFDVEEISIVAAYSA